VGRENLGANGGLNYLLEKATGKYVAIQDHDDIRHPVKVGTQEEILEGNGSYVGCGTAIVNYYEKYDTFLLRRQPRLSRVAWHTSLVFGNSDRRYNSEVRVANDFHFMKHVLCANRRRIYNMDEPYVLRRIRADNSNLSGRWISLRNIGQILRVRISLFDKLALLHRLFLPNRLADYLVLSVFLRRSVLARANVEDHFFGAGEPGK
jgi:glycosyltransferase involved in cell wall biosynthesis